MKTTSTLVIIGTMLLATGTVAMGDVVWHDPWLNWDFINQNPIGATIAVDDFAIIVDSPNWVPQQWWALPFPNSATTGGDFDNDGDQDTKIEFSGAWIQPNQTAHGGLYMLGSGFVLDAYWTLGGVKQYVSTPITYEQTEIRGDPEVHMHLNIAPGFFADTLHPDYPDQEAGWTNIRTFVNIPADMLDLPNLTSALDLDDPNLTQYEVQPYNGVTRLPINLTDQIIMTDDSRFDVFLAEIDPNYASPEYEALLYAQVINQPNVVGQFWNLNPQSPEPATLGLLALGGLVLLRRRRRRREARRTKIFKVVR